MQLSWFLIIIKSKKQAQSNLDIINSGRTHSRLIYKLLGRRNNFNGRAGAQPMQRIQPTVARTRSRDIIVHSPETRPFYVSHRWLSKFEYKIYYQDLTHALFTLFDRCIEANAILTVKTKHSNMSSCNLCVMRVWVSFMSLQASPLCCCYLTKHINISNLKLSELRLKFLY